MNEELSRIDINGVTYYLLDENTKATAVTQGRYNSSNQRIELLNADNNVVSFIDATNFIKDGMVSNVSIVNGNLVITFNTDAGKSPISIPLTSIFNPSNYYQKSEIDSKLAEKQSEISNLESKIGYYECSSEESSASKTISASNYVLGNGGSIKIKMTNANTANNVTLNINSTGARPLFYNGSQASSSNSWESGETLNIYFDGTNYCASNVEGVSKQTIDDINRRIDELYAASIKVSLVSSPSVIYKGVNTQISLTGRMTDGTPTSMTLKDGNTVLKTSSSSPITHSMTVNLSESTKEYQLVAVAMNKTFNDTTYISARHPIYYGFGANATAVATSVNRVSPTTTASGTYTKTASVSSQHFYILVPNDITPPTTFVMGGMPFVMNSSTQTINSISYNVFESGNVYNSGTTLDVTAS